MTVYNYSDERFYEAVSFYEGSTFLGSANWNKSGNTQTSILTLGLNTVQTSTNLVAVWPGSTSTYRLNLTDYKFKSSTIGFVTAYDPRVFILGISTTTNISYGGTLVTTVTVSPPVNSIVMTYTTASVQLSSSSLFAGQSTDKLLGRQSIANSPNTSTSVTFTSTNFSPFIQRYREFFTATITATLFYEPYYYYGSQQSFPVRVCPGNPDDVIYYPYATGTPCFSTVKIGDYFVNGYSGATTLTINYNVAYDPSLDINFDTVTPTVVTRNGVVSPYMPLDGGPSPRANNSTNPTRTYTLSNQNFTTTREGRGVYGLVTSTKKTVLGGTITYSLNYLGYNTSSTNPVNNPPSITLPIYLYIDLMDIIPAGQRATIENGCAVSVSSYSFNSTQGVNAFYPVTYLPDRPLGEFGSLIFGGGPG